MKRCSSSTPPCTTWRGQRPRGRLRARIRHRLQPRLGRQGRAVAGHQGRGGAQLQRIHRSNLVGMGVLPLRYKAGDSWESLGLTGTEIIDVVPDPSSRRKVTRSWWCTARTGLAGGHRHPGARHPHRSRLLPRRRRSAVCAAPVVAGLGRGSASIACPNLDARLAFAALCRAAGTTMHV